MYMKNPMPFDKLHVVIVVELSVLTVYFVLSSIYLYTDIIISFLQCVKEYSSTRIIIPCYHFSSYLNYHAWGLDFMFYILLIISAERRFYTIGQSDFFVQ